MTECHKCDLCKTRKNMVIGRGDPDADIWFVGEAPGRKEDESGYPFVGPAGKVLNKALETLALGQGKYYVTNVVRCRPTDDGGKNRAPTPEEKETCGEHLIEDINRYKPKVVVTLGRHATDYILEEEGSVMERAGWTFPKTIGRHETYVFVMLHPASLLYRSKLKRKWKKDLNTLKRIVRTGEPYDLSS